MYGSYNEIENSTSSFYIFVFGGAEEICTSSARQFSRVSSVFTNWWSKLWVESFRCKAFNEIDGKAKKTTYRKEFRTWTSVHLRCASILLSFCIRSYACHIFPIQFLAFLQNVLRRRATSSIAFTHNHIHARNQHMRTCLVVEVHDTKLVKPIRVKIARQS